MTNTPPAKPTDNRFWWLDGIKGISILWIVFFHFFCAYNVRYPWVLDSTYFRKFTEVCAPSSVLQQLLCWVQSVFVGVSQLGFHAVGVFLVASGFGLTYSLAKTGSPRNGWFAWFRKRLLRLLPMYWVAHLIYLVSPFVYRSEPVDYRFLLSFFGIRIYPLESIFFYANPAWWYFGLLLELYLVFPLLYRLLQKLGATRFLLVCGAGTLATRFLLLFVIPVHGYYLQGAFFGARLWEFAAGMALGLVYREQPALVEKCMFARSALLGGVLVYALGLFSYAATWSYTFTDPLIGTGLFVMLAHAAAASYKIPRFAAVVSFVGIYSYGLYLVHQPYVIYVGERLRGFSMPVFLVAACATMALLTLCVIPVERSVNQLVARLITRPKVPPVVGVAGEHISKKAN
jgi:peptidoglycan/LPS O-acetylase OafA/YrhL